MGSKKKEQLFLAKVKGKSLYMKIADGNTDFVKDKRRATGFNADYVNQVIEQCKYHDGTELEKVAA